MNKTDIGADRIKELSSKQLKQTFIDAGSKTTKGPLYETKPAYIAKKIEDEDLFGESVRGNVLGLSQIQEERGNEDDELGVSMQKEEDQGAEPTTTNIFKIDMLASSKYKEYNKGPVVRHGKLVRHSIVGPVEVFERHQKTIKRNSKEKDATMSFEKDNLSTSEAGSSLTRTHTFKFQQSMGLEHNSSFMGTSSANMGGILSKKQYMQEGRKRDAAKKEVRVLKEDLVREIERMKERQTQFYEEMEEKLKELPVGDRLRFSKDERCLEKYQGIIEDWERLILKNNNKVHRDPGFSVAVRGEDYRKKREIADAFDAVKNDFEKYGSIYWFMTLRKDEELKDTRPYVAKDFPDAFNNTFMERKSSEVEIIRKPDSQSNSKFEFSSSFKNTSKTEKEYLDLRMTQNERQLKKIIPQATNDIKELVIHGKNKLDSEVETLFKNPKKTEFSVPRNFFDRNNIAVEKVDEEIIDKKYERTEIIRNGLSSIIQ